MKKLITIVACWDGGDYYPQEYVNRLYAACRRHTTIPFDFVLYAGPLAERPGRIDAINPDIRVVYTGLPSWWCGMPVWQKNPPGVDTDTILYLDIDQVIVGSLDDLIRYGSDLAGMKDYPAAACPRGCERDVCISTMLIRNGAGAIVWAEYVRAGKPVWDATGGQKGPLPMAAQGLVNAHCRPDAFPEAWIVSYKGTYLKRGLPDDCRVVAFHGQPKQGKCLHEKFVAEHWI
jgi:hypothetical protein